MSNQNIPTGNIPISPVDDQLSITQGRINTYRGLLERLRRTVEQPCPACDANGKGRTAPLTIYEYLVCHNDDLEELNSELESICNALSGQIGEAKIY